MLYMTQNKSTDMRGSSSGSAPLRWKNPSTKMPFFPLQTRKNRNKSGVDAAADPDAPSTQKISRWLRDTKLDRPMSMSTSPLLLLRPIVARRLRIVKSKSRPSRRASATPCSSPAGDHDKERRAAGLDGAERSASRAYASLSVTFGANMAADWRWRPTENRHRNPKQTKWLLFTPRSKQRCKHTPDGATGGAKNSSSAAPVSTTVTPSHGQAIW